MHAMAEHSGIHSFIVVQLIAYLACSVHPVVYSSVHNQETEIQLTYNLSGVLGQGYYMRMLLGKPAQSLSILIDTGSSNFAVAAAPNPSLEKFFNVSGSETLANSGQEINVRYTEGSWKGLLATDIVQLNGLPNVTDFRANIALIKESNEFFINNSRWHGILGLAYREIALPNSSVEPFVETLVRRLQLADKFSIQLCSSDDTRNESDDIMTGELAFGVIKPTLFTGKMLYVLLKREWYYEIVVTGMAVGNQKLNLDCKMYNEDKSIVDTGSTNLRLPSKAYVAVIELLKQQIKISSPIPSSFWTAHDLLCWPRARPIWHVFPTLNISLAAPGNSEVVDLVLGPRQYIRRISKQEADGDGYHIPNGTYCYRLAIDQSDMGTVLGAVVMEGFYTVFDREHKRIGFAKANCTSRLPHDMWYSVVTGPFIVPGNVTARCAYVDVVEDHSTVIAVYVILSICGVLLVVVLLVSIRSVRRAVARLCQRFRRSTRESGALFMNQDM